jgi:hypothetical protein
MTAAERLALRDALAVVVSCVELLARHVDRLPRERRDAQFAALLSSTAEVQRGFERMLEDGR